MKNIRKIITALAFLSLVICLCFGIAAHASEEPTDGGETLNIMSKNVSYDANLYIYYAVPKASVPAGESFYLSGVDARGSFTVKEYTEEKVHGVECYVFKTRGVSAKEINVAETVWVVAGDKVGESVSYSVEQYLYERLYKEGFAAKTTADGKDYSRQRLYFKLLEYGATAQELLLPDAEDKIADTLYFGAPAGDALEGLGEFSEGKEIRLVGTNDEDGRRVSYWNFVSYDAFGKNKIERKLCEGYVITLGNECAYATPVYEDWGADGIEMINTVSFADGEDTSDVTVSLSGGATSEVFSSITDAKGVTHETVLGVNNVKGVGATLITTPTEYVPYSDTIVWEADILAKTYPVEIQFGDLVKGKDGLVYLSSSNSMFTYTGTSVKANFHEWVHFRFEYTIRYDEELGYDVYIATVSMDDLSYTKTGKSTVELDTLDRFKFYMGYDATGYFYFDNVHFSVPSYPTIQFSGDKADSLIKVSTGTAATSEIVPEYTDKNGVTHKDVLHVTKTEKGAVAFTVSVTDSDEYGANAFIFECDAVSYSSAAFAEISYSGGKLMFDASSPAYSDGRWFHYKIVYKETSAGVWQAIQYVNGTQYTISKITCDVSFDKLTGITLKNWNNTVPIEYYIDNVRCYRGYVAD